MRAYVHFIRALLKSVWQTGAI